MSFDDLLLSKNYSSFENNAGRTDGRADGRTDGRTDTTFYKDAYKKGKEWLLFSNFGGLIIRLSGSGNFFGRPPSFLGRIEKYQERRVIIKREDGISRLWEKREKARKNDKKKERKKERKKEGKKERQRERIRYIKI